MHEEMQDGRTDGRTDGESEDSEEDAIVALPPRDRPRPLRPRDVVMDGRTGMRVAAAARRPPKEQSDTRLSPSLPPSPGAKTENGEKEGRKEGRRNKCVPKTNVI